MSSIERVRRGRWRALDDDPQFHLTLSGPQQAGIYRFRVRLHGAAVRAPCLYFDLGSGWNETSRFELSEDADGGYWSMLLPLPSGVVSVRFDPTNQAGEFNFFGMTVARLDSADVRLSAALGSLPTLSPGTADVLAEIIEEMRLDGSSMAAWETLRLPDSAWALPGPSAYAQWVARFDTLSQVQRRALIDAVARLPRRPLLSLVIPVTIETGDMDQLVASLLAQIYPDWELLLVYPGDATPDVLEPMERHVTRSSRVRLLTVPAAAADSLLVREGVLAAQGAFIAVLDAPVRFASHALLMLVETIQRVPQARVIYADDDRADALGRRHDPYFKPQWDPHLLLTHDHVGPLVLCDAALMRDVTARSGAEASTTHGRLLCIAARIEHSDVMHVPHVLYHVANSPASTEADCLVSALTDHLDAHVPGSRLSVTDGVPRIHRRLPDTLPTISIMIPTRDRLDLLRRCVDSILTQSTYERFEIIIIDNQSMDPDTLSYLHTVGCDARVRVLPFDAPFNYSAINNFAVSQADGEFVVLLNNDIEVISPDWLEEMLQYASMSGVGAVGAMLYYPDDTIQHAGVVVGLGGVAGHMYPHAPRGFGGQRGRARHVQSLSAVTAACLMCRRSSYLSVGGLDETLAIAFNDVDFCLRLLEAGLRNVWTPFAELYHHESASRGVEDTLEKQARFAGEVDRMLNRWRDQLQSDPVYHPNLSLTFNSAFKLAEPPRASLAQWVSGFVERG